MSGKSYPCCITIYRRDKYTVSKRLKGYISIFIEVMTILLLSYTFCFPSQVDGSSMEPEYSTGDRIFISHISAWTKDINRGDTVVCRLGDMRVIKRIIAVPGDKLEIKAGKVYLNNSLIEEPYLAANTYTGGSISISLEQDEYFVMGDNRGVSLDSRKEGCVKDKDIKGKVIFKF